MTARTCPLCEAMCGLDVTLADGQIKVRPDAEDVLSHGFICPKGASLGELHADPDRLRVPLVRQADGTLAEASWEEAFAVIAARLPAIVAEHGADSVAAYLGNPSAHALGAMMYQRVLLKAIGTRNVFSASTVDQFPKQVAAGLLFGSAFSVAVPDLDRTDWLLMLGANPLASNGSLLTAPNVRGRLRAIQARGGRVVVVDPRRTRTAELADEHVFVRPGTDALLLFAMLHVIFAEGLASLGDVPASLVSGLDEVASSAGAFAPSVVAPACGVDAEVIARLARELCAAPRAAVYGRIGTTTTSFGALASALIDVLNLVSGNLDRPGGAMFATPVAGSQNTSGRPGRGRGLRLGRYASRVRGLGEVLGELPVAALAEEIETPGEGQVRALVTIAGNPAVSTPNSARLSAALESLDFMVCLDIYLNETTRHADVILPGVPALQKSHYDLILYGFAVRNVANYSPPLMEREAGVPDEWEILLRLTAIVTGAGADADLGPIDDFVARSAVERECRDEFSVLAGADVDAVMGALAPSSGPERLLDLALRCGPFGAGFPSLGLPGRGVGDEPRRFEMHDKTGIDALAPLAGGGAGAGSAPGEGAVAGSAAAPATAAAGGDTAPEGDAAPATGAAPPPACLDALLAHPHGIDYGPPVPRLPEVLRTASGTIELAAPALVAEAERLALALDDMAASDGDLVLIGRRDLRSNNSWMHNIRKLVAGPERCTAQMHPEDASRLGVGDGELVRVTARTGTIEIAAEVTEDVMPGVVSIPHGWGHGGQDGLSVASSVPGVNTNVLTDELELEPLSGTAVLNGIPVEVAPLRDAVVA